jgi:hypothetical protein
MKTDIQEENDLAMARTNEGGLIPPKDTCDICHERKRTEFPLLQCPVCQKSLCKKCSVYGFCPDHFQDMIDQDKLFFIENYRTSNHWNWVFFSLFITITGLGVWVFFGLGSQWGFWSPILIFTLDLAIIISWVIKLMVDTKYEQKIRPALNEIIKKYAYKDR